MDQIFTAKKMLEKARVYSVEIHQIFIALQMAYNSVWTNKLYEITTLSGIPNKLIKLIKRKMNDLTYHVKTGLIMTDGRKLLETRRWISLKQGDGLEPNFFNTAL
jgi:hypothetical protein